MTLKNMIRLAPLAALLYASLGHAALADKASVYLYSTPGSWVGSTIGAPEALWTHGEEGIFQGGYNYGSQEKGVEIRYRGDDDWSFQFSGPEYDKATNTLNQKPLSVGFYDKATRYPFNSPTRPGIDINGGGHGDNTEYGWFNVLEVSYDAQTGELASFAVDFRQYDEATGPSGPFLYGSLRFNSDIAIHAIPEPSTYAMLVGGLAVLGFAARRRKSMGNAA